MFKDKRVARTFIPTRAEQLSRYVKQITTVNSLAIRALLTNHGLATCSTPAHFRQPIDSSVALVSLSTSCFVDKEAKVRGTLFCEREVCSVAPQWSPDVASCHFGMAQVTARSRGSYRDEMNVNSWRRPARPRLLICCDHCHVY